MIWTVDDDGPADFHTIHEAVNASNSGDTIFVWNGTYNENIVIDKPLTLVGENPLNTIIDGNKTGVVVYLNSGNVSVSGFTIRDGGSSGLYIWNGHDCHIHNLIIMNNSDEGIACVNSHNCFFDSLTTTHNKNGIYFGGTYDSEIINTTISNNNVGVYLTMSGRSLIVNNVIQENGIGVYLEGDHTFYHNSFVNNSLQVNGAFPAEWDDDYPSGGNYWSDHIWTDMFNGPHQNWTGSDGIADAPYVVDYWWDMNTGEWIPINDLYPITKPYGGSHDVGVINVTTSKTLVGQGFSLSINVIVVNYGVTDEAFNVTIYANETMIQTNTFNLTYRNSTIIVATWNTTSFAKSNYLLRTIVEIVPQEIDLSDNVFTGNLIKITMIGDLTGTNGQPDSKCDLRDIGLVARKFGRQYPEPEYNPNCDIIYDLKIDMRDVSEVAHRFGETDP
jgi:parallel beta-helix repeat protein